MSAPHAESLLDTILGRGRILIAAQWELTAEQYLDPDTGEPAGVVGKVGRLLANDLGVDAGFVDMTWDEQLPALLAGKVDICLKHTNTPQRAFQVDFVHGRLEKYVGKIIVRKDRDWRLERELDRTGRIVAAIAGSHQEAQIHARYPAATVRTFQTEHEGMESVRRGEADACLGDAWVPNFLLLHGDECEALTDETGEPVITSLDYGHPCIRKGDPVFLNWLNNWMDYHDVQGSFERAIADAYAEHKAKFRSILAAFLNEGATA